MEPKQSKGRRRDTIDKYYTCDTVVDECIRSAQEALHISPTQDLIIEPSAGNGSFIEGIKTLCANHLFYDIEPEHDEIVMCDYLTVDTTEIRHRFSRIHLIGNPPFGRQSSLAIKFIKHSTSFCDSLSFILPKSFKKASLQKRVPPLFHLLYEVDLPEKSFLVNGCHHDVPCVFQIWEKRNYARPVSEVLEPTNFQFVKKHESPDISFRRVGVNAGTIDRVIETKSPQSHYFIRFNPDVPIDETIKKLSGISFAFNNTVGPRSISKQELLKEFVKVL
jgi:predicted RNA methylase